MKKGVYLTRINASERIWRLPKKIMVKLHLKELDQVKILCGNKSVDASVSSATLKKNPSANEGEMSLSEKCFEALSIPNGLHMILKKEKAGEFRIGPVVGLLTFSGYVPRLLHIYKTYAQMSKSAGLFYVFKSEDINMKKKIIKGYTYNPSDRSWTQRELPFPDVVIDRRYPNAGQTHTLLEKVIGPGKIFNKNTMITKIDFDKTIRQDEILCKYLPETKVLRTAADLDFFINKYGRAILKPVNAMKGIGIIIVEKEKNQYKCSYNSHGKNMTAMMKNTSEIFDMIKKVSGSRRLYVIQQLIQTMRYKNSAFSFRTCPMKNGEGKWVMPGMLVLGLGNGVVTNYSSGGKRIPIASLFQDIGNRIKVTAPKMLDELTGLSFAVAKVLDKKYGPLEEIGIDIILDATGRPWLLEANGNPGTAPIFHQKEYPSWPIQLYLYPLEYAHYLSGFTSSNKNVILYK